MKRNKKQKKVQRRNKNASIRSNWFICYGYCCYEHWPEKNGGRQQLFIAVALKIQPKRLKNDTNDKAVLSINMTESQRISDKGAIRVRVSERGDRWVRIT